MKHDDIAAARPVRIAARIATDSESDDLRLQDHTQFLMRRVGCFMPFRRAYEGLRKAAKISGTVLLDQHGNPAALADLSDDDYYRFSYWYRDFLKERASDIVRRNRGETIERRRFLITLCRMAFPFEMAAFGRSPQSFRLETTDRDPLPDQL